MTGVLVGAVAVLVAGALVPMRQRDSGLRTARAVARSAHARLGHLLATADADTVRRARERWTTAGAPLSRARSAEDHAPAEASGTTITLVDIGRN